MVLLNFMSGLASMIPATAGASFAGFLALAVLAAIVIHVMIKNSTVSVCAAAALIAVCILVYLISPAVYEGVIPALLNALALFDRLGTFQNGMFDLTAVIFYLSIAVLFVYLTVQSMEKKRWN